MYILLQEGANDEPKRSYQRTLMDLVCDGMIE
jgi:hypothetical protein